MRGKFRVGGKMLREGMLTLALGYGALWCTDVELILKDFFCSSTLKYSKGADNHNSDPQF